MTGEKKEDEETPSPSWQTFLKENKKSFYQTVSLEGHIIIFHHQNTTCTSKA